MYKLTEYLSGSLCEVSLRDSAAQTDSLTHSFLAPGHVCSDGALSCGMWM